LTSARVVLSFESIFAYEIAGIKSAAVSIATVIEVFIELSFLDERVQKDARSD
jgi:hypothetical protein